MGAVTNTYGIMPIHHKSIKMSFFDEGHCISQWGDTFREDYSQVGKLRWFLPNTSILRDIATLTYCSSTRRQAEATNARNYIYHGAVSNDRWNIVYAVREMKYHQSTYADLGFLIPVDWQTGNNPIPAKFLSSSTQNVRQRRRRNS